MAKSKSNQIEIVSIKYKVNGKIFTTKPIEKKKSEAKNKLLMQATQTCTPGDTKCENGILWRCFDIGGGQTDWLNADEPC
jgi:hypothetical protein